MAAQRISAALLRWNAARASILECVQLEPLLSPLSHLVFGQLFSGTEDDQLQHGGAQNGAKALRGSSEVAGFCSSSARVERLIQPLESTFEPDFRGREWWQKAASGSSFVLGWEPLIGAAKRGKHLTIPLLLPGLSRPIHSSSRKQKLDPNRTTAQDAFQRATSTTTFDDQRTAPGVENLASNNKQVPPWQDEFYERLLRDEESALPLNENGHDSVKGAASIDEKSTTFNDKGAEPPSARVLKAGDRVTPAVWMLETKKRNKVLEPAVEKIIATKGEEKLHLLFENLQARWRKNGASACGRMIYCLKRLIEMKDVDRTLSLMRWLSARIHYKDSRKLRVTRGHVGEMLETLGLPVPPDCVYVAPARKSKKPTWYIEDPPLHERIKKAPREPHWSGRGQW